MNRRTFANTKRWIIPALVAVVLFSLCFAQTSHSLRASPDTVMYTQGAISLFEDGTYKSTFPRSLWEGPRDESKAAVHILTAMGEDKIAITPFPSLTSRIYASTLFFNDDLTQNIAFLNSAALSICFLLIYFIITYFTKNQWLGLVASIYIVITPFFVEKFLWGWSEGLFIVVALCSLASLLTYAETDKKRYLYVSALFVLTSYLLRLQGLALIPAGVMFIAVQGRKKWKDAFIFGALSSSLFIVTFIYRKFFGAGEIGYPLHFFPDSIFDALKISKEFFKTLITHYLFFPPKVAGVISKVSLYIGTFALLLNLSWSAYITKNKGFRASIAYVFFLSAVTLAGIIFMNVIGPTRYQMPIFPFLILAIIFSLNQMPKGIQHLLIVTFIITIPFKILFLVGEIKSGVLSSSFNHPSDINSIAPITNNILTTVYSNGTLFSNDSQLAYGSMYFHNTKILPLPYTANGFNALMGKISQRPIYIIWKINEKGLPIFDTSTQKIERIEYDQNFITTNDFTLVNKIDETHLVLKK